MEHRIAFLNHSAWKNKDDWHSPFTTRDPEMPEMEGKEFLLLARARQLNRKVEWTELRDYLTCSYGRRQGAMENLQKKGLIKKVDEIGRDKYYKITNLGKHLIHGKKKEIVNEAVKHGPMKEKHAKVLKDVIDDRVNHLEHVWVDPHRVEEEVSGGPDLIVTPVNKTGTFSVGRQYAIEVTKDPAKDKQRLIDHYKHNRERLLATIFVPVYEEDLRTIEKIIKDNFENQIVHSSEENLFDFFRSYDHCAIETRFSLEKVRESNAPKVRKMTKVDKEIVELRRNELKKEPEERRPFHTTWSGTLFAIDIDPDMIITKCQIRSGSGDDRKYHGVGTDIAKQAVETENMNIMDRLEDWIEWREEKLEETDTEETKKKKIRKAMDSGGNLHIKKGMVWAGDDPVCEYDDEAEEALFDLLHLSKLS